MKAIIIQDTDARALLDQLKLETMDARHRDYAEIEMAIRKILDPVIGDSRKLVEVCGKIGSLLSDPAGEISDQIHRRFYFVVCRWLQEQGASVLH